MLLIDTILEAITGVIDKVVPDANVREQVKSQLAQQAYDWRKLELDDRDSARKREMALGDTTVRQLAWAYTGGYFALLTALLSGYVHIADSLADVLNVLLGVLTAGQYSVMQYYFGSSSGSVEKSKLLSR